MTLKTLTFAASLTLLANTLAHAVGPVPNGRYKGTWICISAKADLPANNVTLVFTDRTIEWESTGGFGYLHSVKTFATDANGFMSFNITTDGRTPLGTGTGYTTRRGIHYELKILGVPGEETYVVAGPELVLLSSLEDLQNGRLHCEGRFTSAD